MDLEDDGWVNIPYDGLLEVHDEGDEKIFSRKHVNSPTNFFKPDYFSTQQKTQNFVQEQPRFGKQLVPFPTQLDHEDEVKEIIKLPILINKEPESDQDPIFQVFFMKENQFVEMKIDSSRLTPQETDLPCIESGDQVVNCSSPSKMINQEVVAWKESHERLNLWRWGSSGIGAFCSLGMAAVTIYIVMFGNGRRHKQQNQKLRIQICSENKRIQQVVHQANEAMSAVRGVPLAKAHITYGGSYEDL